MTKQTFNTKGAISDIKNPKNVHSTVKTNYLIITFSFFAIAYLLWVLATYRNEMHMDIMTIVSTKVKALMEERLQAKDFIYQPMFPCVTSIIFTFLSVKIFHLNTVAEIALGAILLITLGCKYLIELAANLHTKKSTTLFGLLMGFVVFGLHKWEASFTSFFSFSVFFDLCICFFNYFFVFKYIHNDGNKFSAHHLALVFFSNLLVIIEAPAYFYGYVLSVLIALFLTKRFQLTTLSVGRWGTIVRIYTLLLLLAISITTTLSHHPLFKQYTSALSISHFLGVFLQKPLWIIKFYLIAQSGPYLGEVEDGINSRALFGLFIMIAYIWGIWLIIKRKDARLLAPLAMMFYNIISYGFITISRYTFNSIEYGASSRYTAFNLSGVLGLTTILFFYILDSKKRIYRYSGMAVLIAILIGYLYVDIRQLQIAPYRTAAFKQIQTALHTGENLDILQADTTASLEAIEVLRKYKLNVYYGMPESPKQEIIHLNKIKKYNLAVGSSEFDETIKEGFYTNENGIVWTNGRAAFTLTQNLEIKDSLTLQLNTYLPPACKTIVPEVTLQDIKGNIYQTILTKRVGDTFFYSIIFSLPTHIKKISFISNTIDATPDVRVLSFPFISLELRR